MESKRESIVVGAVVGAVGDNYKNEDNDELVELMSRQIRLRRLGHDNGGGCCCLRNDCFVSLATSSYKVILLVTLLLLLLLGGHPVEGRSVDHRSSTTSLQVIQNAAAAAAGVSSGSSLSIMSPLEVLRQNMVLEIVRRRLRHAKQKQLITNKQYLDMIG